MFNEWLDSLSLAELNDYISKIETELTNYTNSNNITEQRKIDIRNDLNLEIKRLEGMMQAEKIQNEFVAQMEEMIKEILAKFTEIEKTRNATSIIIQ